MNQTLKGVCRVCKKSLSLVLSLSMMMSICVISGFSLNASATSTVAVDETYDTYVPANFTQSNIVGVDATYFDYISDEEYNNTYLKPIQAGTGFNGSSDNWYPFYIFNRAMRNVANNNSWSIPLYIGNFCNTSGAYDTSTHSGDYNNAVNTEALSRFNYAANNSNGISNMNQSYQGLVESSLNSSSKLMASSTLEMPYFDAEFLSQNFNSSGNVSSSGKRIAKIYKSQFPFRTSTNSSGVTTYSFDSTNATDNVYFTWSGTTPTAVNYGAGSSYGVKDGIQYFMNPNTGQTSGYGIFPFNNGSSAGSNGGNNNLNYGFGVRLDINFRVPANGTVNGSSSGTPITFDYSGDDDLWVYLTDDEGNSELVLDLGGSHKMAEGSINFNTMTATANDVYTNAKSGTTVPSDEIWVEYGSYTDFCLYAWNSSSNAYIKPYATADGWFKFKSSQLSSYTGGIFCKWQNINDGKLSGDLTLSNLYGKTWTATGSEASTGATNLGSETYTFNNGTHLDPTKTYKLTVFYMERGLIESNFQVGFTFTPLTNTLTTEKEVNTANVNSGLASAVKAKDTFTITNQKSDSQSGTYSALGSKNYTYTTSSGASSTKTSNSSGAYSIADGASASFTKITDTNDWLKVTETETSNLDYTTTYTVTDVENDNLVKATGTGKTANFLFSNSNNSTGGDEYLTNYNVKFVNTPVVNDLTVSKTAYDTDGSTEISDKAFEFAAMVDLNGGTNYSAYNLEYSVNGGSTQTATDGKFTLTGGQTATFKNIPVGASYKIVETADEDYTTTPSSRSVTGTVTTSTSTNSASFVNTKIDKSDATVTLGATKLLDGTTPDVDIFEFTLTKLTKSGSTFSDTRELVQTVNNNDGKVQFDTLKYPYVEQETTEETTTQQVTTVVPTTTVPATTVPVTTAPVEEESVYFVPNNYWKNNNSPRYAYYVWNDSGNKWVSMSDTDGDGVYSAVYPEGYTNIIFCAMDPNSSTNSWDTKWNQTDDLTLSGSYNCYTYNDNQWDKGTGSWTVYGSAVNPYSEPQESVKVVNANLTASSTEKYYYEIAENTLSNTTYSYDSSKYYAVVTVDRSSTPNTASAKYYATETDAINETNAIEAEDVVFNNFHLGSMEITKYGSNRDVLITDSVKFKLYKTDSNGGELNEANVVAEKTVDANGKVLFDNLDIYVGQSEEKADSYQWYCFVESDTKDGYSLNGTKYYFTIPLAEEVEDQSSDTYDFESDSVKYEYILKDGARVYDLTCDVDNFLVTSPNASGSGMSIFLVIGLGIILTGGLLFMAYTAYDRAQRKKRMARCNARRS